MTEPLSNMRLICDHHRLSPNPTYSNLPVEHFMGKYCKLAFPQPEGEYYEYMWVQVIGLAETPEEELRGILDNDPVKATQFTCGDLVEFRRNEIIAPVRRAALLSEPFSKVIRERHAWGRAAARRQVRAAFAPELDALSEPQRSDRIAALRALLSFSYWEELRRHSRLSAEAASRVLRDAVQAQMSAVVEEIRRHDGDPNVSVSIQEPHGSSSKRKKEPRG